MKSTFKILFVYALVASLTIPVMAQQKRGVRTNNGSDISSMETKAITVETWDENQWEVFTDKDSVIPPTYYPNDFKYKEEDTSPQAYRKVALVAGYPKDVKEVDLSEERKKDAKVLAVKFSFTYPGHNEVTIRPPRSDFYKVKRLRDYVTENDLSSDEAKKDPSQRQPKRAVNDIYGVELPGLTKALSVWVLGRGLDYELEAWFEDYMGNTHVLKFGSLKFVGWRALTVKIPEYVPQSVEEYPQTKTLVFKQFKVRSTPNTRSNTAYIFFDEMKALTDTFDVHFDGASIDFPDDELFKDQLSDCYNKTKFDKLEKRVTKGKLLKDCKGGGDSPAKK